MHTCARKTYLFFLTMLAVVLLAGSVPSMAQTIPNGFRYGAGTFTLASLPANQGLTVELKLLPVQSASETVFSLQTTSSHTLISITRDNKGGWGFNKQRDFDNPGVMYQQNMWDPVSPCTASSSCDTDFLYITFLPNGAMQLDEISTKNGKVNWQTGLSNYGMPLTHWNTNSANPLGGDPVNNPQLFVQMSTSVLVASASVVHMAYWTTALNTAGIIADQNRQLAGSGTQMNPSWVTCSSGTYEQPAHLTQVYPYTGANMTPAYSPGTLNTPCNAPSMPTAVGYGGNFAESIEFSSVNPITASYVLNDLTTGVQVRSGSVGGLDFIVLTGITSGDVYQLSYSTPNSVVQQLTFVGGVVIQHSVTNQVSSGTTGLVQLCGVAPGGGSGSQGTACKNVPPGSWILYGTQGSYSLFQTSPTGGFTSVNCVTSGTLPDVNLYHNKGCYLVTNPAVLSTGFGFNYGNYMQVTRVNQPGLVMYGKHLIRPNSRMQEGAITTSFSQQCTAAGFSWTGADEHPNCLGLSLLGSLGLPNEQPPRFDYFLPRNGSWGPNQANLYFAYGANLGGEGGTFAVGPSPLADTSCIPGPALGNVNPDRAAFQYDACYWTSQNTIGSGPLATYVYCASEYGSCNGLKPSDWIAYGVVGKYFVIVQAGSMAPNVSCTNSIFADPDMGATKTCYVYKPPTTNAVSASELDFALEPGETASQPQALVFSNTGTAPLTVSSVTITGSDPGDFVDTNQCSGSIAAGSSCVIWVNYTAADQGGYATLTITSSDTTQPEIVNLFGATVPTPAPAVTLSSTALSFTGAGGRGPTTVTLTNSGDLPLAITTLSITGTGANQFTKSDTCTNTSLIPGATCQITVTYVPTAPTAVTAAVQINDNALPGFQVIQLTGDNTSK